MTSSSPSPHASLRTSKDIVDFLLWSPTSVWSPSSVFVGYSDRFVGIKEICLTEFSQGGDIPMHRILYFRSGGVSSCPPRRGVEKTHWPKEAKIIWDREEKIDWVFGSGRGKKNLGEADVDEKSKKSKKKTPNPSEKKSPQKEINENKENIEENNNINTQHTDTSLSLSSISLPSGLHYDPFVLHRFSPQSNQWIPIDISEDFTSPSTNRIFVISFNVLYCPQSESLYHSTEHERWEYLMECLSNQIRQIHSECGESVGILLGFQEVSPSFHSFLFSSPIIRKDFIGPFTLPSEKLRPVGQLLLGNSPLRPFSFSVRSDSSSSKHFSVLSCALRPPSSSPIILHMANCHFPSDFKMSNKMKRIHHLRGILKDFHKFTVPSEWSQQYGVIGDFNMKDDENIFDAYDPSVLPATQNEFSEMPRVVDVFEWGRRNGIPVESTALTYDIQRNPAAEFFSKSHQSYRFDRMAMSMGEKGYDGDAKSDSQMWLNDLRLFGDSTFRSSGGEEIFPSDHFGLLGDFIISDRLPEEFPPPLTSPVSLPVNPSVVNRLENPFRMISTSVQSALCLIPPESFLPTLSLLRRFNDPSFSRWPPHVNLLFPFVSFDLESPRSPLEISQFLEDHLDFPPFRIQFDGKIHSFHHGDSSTIWLKPLDVGDDGKVIGDIGKEEKINGRTNSQMKRDAKKNSPPSQSPLLQLQSAVFSLFPQCSHLNTKSADGFVPHTKIIQIGPKGRRNPLTESEIHDIEELLNEGWTGSEGISKAMKWDKKAVEIEEKNFGGALSFPPISGVPWVVDKVFWVTRDAKGPFTVRAEIPLRGKIKKEGKEGEGEKEEKGKEKKDNEQKEMQKYINSLIGRYPSYSQCFNPMDLPKDFISLLTPSISSSLSLSPSSLSLRLRCLSALSAIVSAAFPRLRVDVIPVGSFPLHLSAENSDLDVLIVLFPRDDDPSDLSGFPTSLTSALNELSVALSFNAEFSVERVVSDAVVPIIKGNFQTENNEGKHKEIPLDIQMAKWTFGTTLPMKAIDGPPMSTMPLGERRALNALYDQQFLAKTLGLSTLPSEIPFMQSLPCPLFVFCLKVLKAWRRCRLLDGAALSFLSPFTWGILFGKFIQKEGKSIESSVGVLQTLRLFFRFIAESDFSFPSSRSSGGLSAWEVPSPIPPHLNTAKNSGRHSMILICEEAKRAEKILGDALESKDKTLAESLKFLFSSRLNEFFTSDVFVTFAIPSALQGDFLSKFSNCVRDVENAVGENWKFEGIPHIRQTSEGKGENIWALRRTQKGDNKEEKEKEKGTVEMSSSEKSSLLSALSSFCVSIQRDGFLLKFRIFILHGEGKGEGDDAQNKKKIQNKWKISVGHSEEK